MLHAKAADIKQHRSRTFEDFSNALIDEDVYRIQMDKLAAEQETLSLQIEHAKNVVILLILTLPWTINGCGNLLKPEARVI